MPTQTRARKTLGRMITVTLAAASFGAPAIAIADSAKEQQLEARIAELEKQVQALLAAQKAAPAPAPAPAAAAAAAPAKAPIQGVSITPNAAPNTTFLLTGYVKADARRRHWRGRLGSQCAREAVTHQLRDGYDP
jgi:hypothetical protein